MIAEAPSVGPYSNTFISELIFLCCSAASADALSSDIPATPETADRQGAQLALPLLTTTFSRRGLFKIVPPQLARNAASEGEFACRQLIRHRAFKGDRALLKNAPTTRLVQVSEVYQELVAWMEELYSLAAHKTMFTGVVDKLARQPQTTLVKVHARLKDRFPGHVMTEETLLTPALAIYVTASVSFTMDYILKLVGQVVEREANTTEVTPRHFWTAVKENEGLWDSFEFFRMRTSLEKAVVRHRKTSVARVSPRSPATKADSPSMSSTWVTLHSRRSAETPPIARYPSTSSKARAVSLETSRAQALDEPFTSLYAGSNQSFPEDDASEVVSAESFEQLMLSGETMKVSLTPQRLRTFDAFDKQKRKDQQQSFPIEHTLTRADAMGPQIPARPAQKPPMRLQARSAYHKNEASESEDEEEDDDVDFLDGPKRRKPKKESLKDLFASDPPWAARDDPVVKPPFLDEARSTSSKMSRMTGMQDISRPNAPASHQTSSLPTPQSASGLSASINSSKSTRPKLVAKDKRRPPTGSKDLIDFLSSAPPPLQMPPTPVTPSPDQTSLTSKKSSRSLKFFLRRNNSSAIDGMNNERSDTGEPWTSAAEADFRGVKSMDSVQEIRPILKSSAISSIHMSNTNSMAPFSSVAGNTSPILTHSESARSYDSASLPPMPIAHRYESKTTKPDPRHRPKDSEDLVDPKIASQSRSRQPELASAALQTSSDHIKYHGQPHSPGVGRSASKVKRVPSPRTDDLDLSTSSRSATQVSYHAEKALPRKRYPSTSKHSHNKTGLQRFSEEAGSVPGHEGPPPQLAPSKTKTSSSSHTPHPSRDLTATHKPEVRTRGSQTPVQPKVAECQQRDASIQATPEEDPGPSFPSYAEEQQAFLLALRAQFAATDSVQECMQLYDNALQRLRLLPQGAAKQETVTSTDKLAPEEALMLEALLGETDSPICSTSVAPAELTEDISSESESEEVHEVLTDSEQQHYTRPTTASQSDSSTAFDERYADALETFACLPSVPNKDPERYHQYQRQQELPQWPTA